LFASAQAQNLVPNSKLEDVNTCTELNAPCSPSAWFCVKEFVPGGYYHQYPDRAASGQQYFELFVVMNAPARQYWQTLLLCKLVPGEKYEASIKVSAHEIGPNLNDIGFYLTKGFIYAQKDTLLQPPDYINFLDAGIDRLKHNWFQLTKTFTAASDAQYLIIGNFSAEDNRSILRKRNQGNLVTLMMDDISIKPVNMAVCAGAQNTKDSLYAIKKRHSGDAVAVLVQPVVTPVNKPTMDSIVTIKEKKTDTLQISNVLFEFDRHVLINPDTLEVFRDILSNPAVKKITVAGFADDAGTAAYNKILSEKRAAEIARLIAVRFSLPSAIIHAEGRGISTLYADKIRNRRVDIYVYY
jgi:outer membrane protein OmpA-like peptidoglycan-associated protein